MREDYDIVEDIRVRKRSNILDSKFLKVMIIGLMFVLLCAIWFNVVYKLYFANIQRNEESSSIINKSNSSKVFIIEQKLRKDLANIQNKNLK